MSLEVQVTFKASDHHESWDVIGELLQQGSVGAKLQDAFDVFGPEAADHLEQFLEEFPAMLLQASLYERSGDQVNLGFEWPAGELEQPKAVEELLRCCAVKSLRFSSWDLSGDR